MKKEKQIVTLKEFIKNVLSDIHLAVQELNDANITTQASKDIAHFAFAKKKDTNTFSELEFYQ